jgi:glucose/arabinose dehydrogenase
MTTDLRRHACCSAVRTGRQAAHDAVHSTTRYLSTLALIWCASVANLSAGDLHTAALPPGFSTQTFASPLPSPTAMAFAPDGRLFVCLQTGALRVVKGGLLLTKPFITLNVDSNGERGLLGVAFDSAFQSNHYVYLYYTAKSPAIHNRISRFTANGDTAIAGSEAMLLDLDNLSGATNHNGGAIHFGPDGKLYAGVGENANPTNSQTLTNLLGKVLRLDSDGGIPTDNPYYGTATGKNRAIWAMGLRNPFTFAFQPGTGLLYINDVGQDSWEEINRGIAGVNYGWPVTEGFTTNPLYVGPLHTYPHGSGNAKGNCIAGGAFYTPVALVYPGSYVGKYFFADYTNNWINLMNPADSSVTNFATGISSPVDLQIGPDGKLYYLARGNGGIVGVVNYSTTGVEVHTTPEGFLLAQNYPNPFNPETAISYQLSAVSKTKLSIYDMLGREVAVLVNETKAPGKYEVRWDASGFPSGTYFYRLDAGGLTKTLRMMLIR